MASRLPSRILRHVATPIEAVVGGRDEWVEGERVSPSDTGDVDGAPFACILFLPNVSKGDGEEQSWRPRQITRPTLLYNLRSKGGDVVTLTKESRVRLAAADLAPVLGSPELEWQVDGSPQPFGPPGRVFGAQAILRLVSD